MSVDKYLTNAEKDQREKLAAFRNRVENLAKHGATAVSPSVNIPVIPKNMSRFGQTDDFWGRVDFPKGVEVVSCVYQFSQRSKFPAHVHEYGELILTLNGSIRVKTYSGNQDDLTLLSDTVVNKYESIFIPENIWHSAQEVGTDSDNTEILCIWFSNILGWIADFKV